MTDGEVKYRNQGGRAGSGAGLGRTSSLKAGAGPVWGAQENLGSSSSRSTGRRGPALTKVVEVLEHSVQKRVRRRRGRLQTQLPRHREICLRRTSQRPAGCRLAAPSLPGSDRLRARPGPRAASVLDKMAAPGALWSGRRGCHRLRRGRAALRGRTAPRRHTTIA